MSVFFRNIVVFFTLLVCIAGSFSHVYVSSEVSEASYVDKFATGGLDGDVLGDDTKYSKQNVLKNTDIVDMGSDSVSVETWFLEKIADILFSIFGVIALLLLVWAAILMITGGSDSSRREKGVSLLKYVSIAILILMFAYPLVAWFFSLGPDGWKEGAESNVVIGLDKKDAAGDKVAQIQQENDVMNALNNGGSYANGGGGSYAQNIQEDVDAMISAAAEATTAAQLALSSVMDDDKNITNTGAYNAIQAFSGAVYGSTEPTGFTGAINAVVENLSGGSFESTLTGSISSATDLQTSGVVSGNITADISSFDPVNNTWSLNIATSIFIGTGDDGSSMSGVLVGAASFENFTLNHPYFSGSIVSGVAKGTFVGTYSTGSHPVSGDKWQVDMEFSADVFITPEIDSLASDAADAIKDFNTTLSGMDINQLNQWSNVESIRTKATNAITEISEFVSVLANISTTTGSIFSIYVRSFLVEPQAVLDTTQKYIDTFDAVNNASSINMRSALEEGDLMLDLSDYNKLSSSEKDLVAAYVYIQKLSAASGKFATRDNIKTALDTKVFQLMSENMTDALLSFNTAVWEANTGSMLSAIVNYGDVSFSGAVLQKYKTFDIDQKRDVASTLIASGAAIGSPYYTILTGETVTNSVAHAFFTKVNQIDTENNTSQTTINTSISAINVATSPATLTGVIATHYVTLGLEWYSDVYAYLPSSAQLSIAGDIYYNKPDTGSGYTTLSSVQSQWNTALAAQKNLAETESIAQINAVSSMDAMWTLLDTADTTYPQYFLDLDLPNSWPSNTGSVAEHMFSESPFSSISDVQSSLESIVSQQEDMDTASVLRSLNEQETATAFQTYFENNSWSLALYSAPYYMGTGYTVILDDDHQGYVMSGVFAAKPTSYTDLYSTGYTSTASLLSDFEEQVEIQLENTMLSDIQTSSDADTLFTAINVTYFGALGLDWDMYNSYIAEDSTLSSSIKAMLFSQKINMADINTIQDIFVQILEDNNPFDLAIIHAAKSGALVDLNNATLASTRSKLEADPFKFTSDDYDYWRLSDIGKNKVAEVVYNAKVASGSYTSIDGWEPILSGDTHNLLPLVTTTIESEVATQQGYVLLDINSAQDANDISSIISWDTDILYLEDYGYDMYQNISNTAAVDEQVYNSGYTYTTISEFQTQFQSAVSQQVSVEAETLAFVTGSLVLVNESASVSDLKNILENNLAAGEIVVNNQTKEVSDVLGLTDYMDGSLADIESNEYYDALMPAYQDLVMQNIHYYKQENGDYMNASAILGALNWAVSYYRDQEDQDALDSVNSVVAGNGTGMIAALTSYSGTLSIDTEMITGEYSSLTYAEKILVGEQMTTYNYTDKSIVKQVFMYTIDQVQNGSLSFDFSVSVDHFFADMFGVFDSFFSLKTQD